MNATHHPGLGELLDADLQGVFRVLGGMLGALLVAVFVITAVPLTLIVATVLSVVPGLGISAPPPAAQSRANSPSTAAVVKHTAQGQDVVEIARRYLGVPYVFGGGNPAVGLDCSGLVQLVFRQLHVALPHNAQAQYNLTARIEPDQLQPGDLVFFARTYPNSHDWITHVGIYVGGGQQINAPTEGMSVSTQPVFSGFWGSHFAGGGRVRAADLAHH